MSSLTHRNAIYGMNLASAECQNTKHASCSARRVSKMPATPVTTVLVQGRDEMRMEIATARAKERRDSKQPQESIQVADV